MENLKKSYITLVTENYLPYLDQLLKTFGRYSNLDLLVYSLNFGLEIDQKNVKTKRIDDNILEDFLNSGEEDSNREKFRASLFNKIRIFKDAIESFDHIFFVDCDSLFTKNSDDLFLNSIKEFGSESFPISVRYFEDFSDTHDKGVRIFGDSGEVVLSSLSYYPISKLLETEVNVVPYHTTYCVYFNKESINFINEADRISRDKRILSDVNMFAPLGDETIFNYLYSKYNIQKYINNNLCRDINPYIPIESFLKTIRKTKKIISFIHTKRIKDYNLSGKNISIKDEDYKRIISELDSGECDEGSIFSLHLVEDDGLIQRIHFSGNSDFSELRIRTVSTSPSVLDNYIIEVNKSSVYWIGRTENNPCVDLYLIFEKADGSYETLDCLKVI